MRPLRLGFLASHRGTSMRAILDAIEAGTLAAEAVLLISNNADAPALDFARERGVPALVLNARLCGGPDEADAAIAASLAEHGANLVLLSGYLRKLGPATLSTFAGRILNIHPALLPHFGGTGMYGDRVFRAVIDADAATSGATIHLVDGEYDHGAILAQCEIPVRPGETVETLAARTQAIEGLLYVETLKAIIDGRLDLDAIKILRLTAAPM